MKPEYNLIYSQLFDSYEEGNFFYRISPDFSELLRDAYYEFRDYNLRREIFSERIKRNITRFEHENKYPLRADAKFFLVSTFDNMIIKPLLKRYIESTQNENVSFYDFENEMFDIIDFDIILILRNSLKNRDGDSKISGHQIIKSVDMLWGEMRSSKFEIWG